MSKRKDAVDKSQVMESEADENPSFEARTGKRTRDVERDVCYQLCFSEREEDKKGSVRSVLMDGNAKVQDLLSEILKEHSNLLKGADSAHLCAYANRDDIPASNMIYGASPITGSMGTVVENPIWIVIPRPQPLVPTPQIVERVRCLFWDDDFQGLSHTDFGIPEIDANGKLVTLNAEFIKGGGFLPAGCPGVTMYLREQVRKQLSFMDTFMNGYNKKTIEQSESGSESRKEEFVAPNPYESAYIYGQPGTGKTTTAFYSAALLSEKRKVIWVHINSRSRTKASIVIMHKRKRRNFHLDVKDVTKDMNSCGRKKTGEELLLIIDFSNIDDNANNEFWVAGNGWRINEIDKRRFITVCSMAGRVDQKGNDSDNYPIRYLAVSGWTLKEYFEAVEIDEFWSSVKVAFEFPSREKCAKHFAKIGVKGKNLHNENQEQRTRTIPEDVPPGTNSPNEVMPVEISGNQESSEEQSLLDTADEDLEEIDGGSKEIETARRRLVRQKFYFAGFCARYMFYYNFF